MLTSSRYGNSGALEPFATTVFRYCFVVRKRFGMANFLRPNFCDLHVIHIQRIGKNCRELSTSSVYSPAWSDGNEFLFCRKRSHICFIQLDLLATNTAKMLLVVLLVVFFNLSCALTNRTWLSGHSDFAYNTNSFWNHIVLYETLLFFFTESNPAISRLHSHPGPHCRHIGRLLVDGLGTKVSSCCNAY